MAGLRATENHQCIICWESVGDLPADNYVQLQCGCIYCRDCINAALELSIRCEANFPLHCACKHPLPIEEIYHLLADKLLDRYFAVLPEWTSVHCTYCAKCLQYIDSKEFREDARYSTCTSCIEETCRECKASKSDHETGCPPDTDRQKLLQLSTSESWKQCSSCGNLIEKDFGCNHMTCLCEHDFCYVCGYSPYDSHDCGVGNGNLDRDEDDWHDDRPDWQEYIFDEEGNPICEHTVFENSPYGGRCQGACGHVLPFYLNECSNCELRVCNYCVAARNFVPREQNDDTADRDVSSGTALDPEQGQTQVHDEGPQQSESATQDDAYTAESTDIVSGVASDQHSRRKP
ncbi:hypothetical protein EPUS_04629 [Endocarpon pusillum Z07020]|uniref:RING-type domain-containing protein n=1 Tax=Endocarpon pusillum (strain Z07020 / HMAS-L-300199) TaxID=1263415 RepID=U1GA19_ENDPU|nr:uncharacterized protein EPUS_04629 [Endocarpon pusillum Z07020]ERF68531.1 hypothetical protein EPUS_04629 [Endocarpon pusillum Z07020]